MNSETKNGDGDFGDWMDPAFDSLLAEAIGGPQPPDLSDRIMFALKNTDGDAEPASTFLTDKGVGGGNHEVVMPPPVQLPMGSTEPHSVGTPAYRAGDGGGYRVVDKSVSATMPHRSHRPLLIGLASLAASIAVAVVYFPDSSEYADSGNQVVIGSGTNLSDEHAEDTETSSSGTKPAHDRSSAVGDANLGDANSSDSNIVGKQGNARQDVGNPPQRPGQAIKLDNPNFAESDGDTSLQDSAPKTVPVFAAIANRLSDAAIVSMIDSKLGEAWAGEGIESTGEVNKDEIGRRLAEILGTDLQLTEGDLLGSLRDGMKKPQVRERLASRLAATMLGRTGVRRIKREQFVAFVEFLKPSFGENRFDAIAGEMLTARGAVEPQADGFNPAAVWIGALVGPQSISLAEQAGHVLLDVDLRCSRCHDHPLDGRVWQDQYWQFSAMFDTGLRWLVGDDGVLRVQSPEDAENQNVIFYERTDGRQRVATPKAPMVWIAGVADSEMETEYTTSSGAAELERLAAAMHNNPQLAKAAVNRVWESVYGRSLVGSAADPSAAPEAAAMLRLQADLAEQFRAHDFDMAKLFTWVLASKPMRLAIPEAWESPAYESATGAQLASAAQQVRAFASFPAATPRRRFNDLLARVNVRDRGLIDSLDAASNFPGGLLGQFQPSAQTNMNGYEESRLSVTSQDQLLAASLEAMEYVGEKTEEKTQASSLPAEWLERVDGPDPFQRRAEHLYYLAGYWHPSPQQLQVARALRDQAEDDATALRRLWWVLANESL